MSKITREELEAAMHPNGKIEDVAIFVPHAIRQPNYFRMCAFTHKQYEGVRNIALFADDNVWLFLPNGHPKAKECGAQEVWKCDIIYRDDHWDEITGSRYWVYVFTVHPKERLEKRS